MPEGARASVLRKQLAERFVILGDAALETNIALNQQYARRGAVFRVAAAPRDSSV